ncbi:MAG: ribosome silencing factor [Thermodesulfobacteriota bacterium]
MTENGLAQWLKIYVKAALGRKAIELVLLDVRGVTDVADVFMVCSGRSNRQVTAIAEFIEKELKKSGIKPLSAEGIKEGHWALLDYGHVVIHVFYDPVRRFYDIESLWADAGRIAVETIVDVTETNRDWEQQNE